MKIDNIMVVDTEAIDLNKSFIYDIGYIIGKKQEDNTF